jgi:predicted phosphodiesterase
MTRLALLSDIHANLPALEAVAAGIDAAAPDAVYVLGDMINGCAWPAETLDFVSVRGWPMLIGNHDDAVAQLDRPGMEPRYADRIYYATLWWTRARLRADHLALIESLPRELGLAFPGAERVRLLHGLPGNFFAGFRPDSPARWVEEQLRFITEPTVVDGHTHFPMERSISRWQIVNTGSAGAPFDGDPRPSYALLDSRRAAAWRVTIRRVDYDRSRVDAGYRASGLASDGGVLSVMFHRSVMTALPWVSDFNWWVRQQAPEIQADPVAALEAYDRNHGPGRWAFPLPS